MEWIFDGIGTQVLVLLITAAVSGFAGYRIGIRNRVSQSQKGGNHAKQMQIGNIVNNEQPKSRR